MKIAVALSACLAAFLGTGCASIDRPDAGNLAAYCTPENAFRLGSQSRAYFGVCPKETEARFLEGLARGRELRPWAPAVEPYYARMSQTEQRLRAAPTEAERGALRERLADLEWWAIHLINNKATFHD